MTTPSIQLENQRIGFLGKLGAMSRKEACQWLKQYSASLADKLQGELDLVIIGADELPDEDIQAMLSASLKERIRSGATRLIHEHELWMELGLIDSPTHKQLYTPAMVAGLVKTRVNAIRRWHRCGLLPCVKVTHKLPYFDFEQVQSAKQIAAWVSQGAKVDELKRQLDAFGPRIADRSLTELDLQFDGRRILLKDEGVLVGAHGQLFLDFDSEEPASSERNISSAPDVAPKSRHSRAIRPASGNRLYPRRASVAGRRSPRGPRKILQRHRAR